MTKQVSLDSEALASAGITLEYESGASIAKLTVTATKDNKNPVFCTVQTDGESLLFYPDRSASQREILKYLQP